MTRAKEQLTLLSVAKNIIYYLVAQTFIKKFPRFLIQLTKNQNPSQVASVMEKN